MYSGSPLSTYGWVSHRFGNFISGLYRVAAQVSKSGITPPATSLVRSYYKINFIYSYIIAAAVTEIQYIHS